jgi:hypothetical protein
VRLIAPIYVKRHRNDAAAGALVEAASRPTMRFVGAASQARAMLLRTRDLLVRRRVHPQPFAAPAPRAARAGTRHRLRFLAQRRLHPERPSAGPSVRGRTHWFKGGRPVESPGGAR